MDSDPAAAAGDGSSVARFVHRNINEIVAHRHARAREQPPIARFASWIAAYCGTPWSIAIHAAVFAFWLLANVGIAGWTPFDPFPFGLLTTIVSLEAIFLSLFVLLAQNHMQLVSDRQSELDLQVNLLTEHELTRVLIAVDAIADKLGVELPHPEERAELEAETVAQKILDEIERAERGEEPGLR